MINKIFWDDKVMTAISWVMVGIAMITFLFIILTFRNVNNEPVEIPASLDETWEPNAIRINGEWLYNVEVTWYIQEDDKEWILVYISQPGLESFYHWTLAKDFVTAIVKEG